MEMILTVPRQTGSHQDRRIPLPVIACYLARQLVSRFALRRRSCYDTVVRSSSKLVSRSTKTNDELHRTVDYGYSENLTGVGSSEFQHKLGIDHGSE
jgi:hypothetical protein